MPRVAAAARNPAEDQSERAREELMAELGVMFLVADLGIAPEMGPCPDHAIYLASWLSVLKKRQRFIFQAAARRRLPPRSDAPGWIFHVGSFWIGTIGLNSTMHLPSRRPRRLAVSGLPSSRKSRSQSKMPRSRKGHWYHAFLAEPLRGG
ncbi:zincin-like metallopeptidase domain-containing protein [Ensifer sp. YR511]|uniref:zincin-like metallopeptidase domain-containing protein n=1 Tax=Ensifer sp. YR511 TaxID=1855294 RepID=UPI00352D12F9